MPANHFRIDPAHDHEHSVYKLGRGFAVVMEYHKEQIIEYQRNGNGESVRVSDRQHVPHLPFHLFKVCFS